MIQQVTNVQVQQAAVRSQQVQQTDNGGTFEALMKSSVGIADKTSGTAGKTVSVKNGSEDKGDAGQKTDASRTPFAAMNAFSVFSLLGQNIGSIQSVLSKAQAVVSAQAARNVNPAGMAQGPFQTAIFSPATVNAQNTVGSTGFAQANTGNASDTVQSANGVNTAKQTANLPQNAGSEPTANRINDGTAQTVNLLQGAGSVQTTNGVNDLENAGSNRFGTIQPAQASGQNVLSSPQVSSSGKTVNSANTESDDSLQAAVSVIPGQPAQQDSGSTLPAYAEQADGITSAFSAQDGAFRTALQKSETTAAEPKSASKNGLNQSDFAGKLQETSFSEKKSNLSDTGTAPQNQGYADLFQTGNVIIPISANPESTAKSMCSQVTGKIAANYKMGKSEFAVDLYPKNLGKVSVKLGIQNGVLTVEISAANPKTQSMLLANTDEIKSILQSSVNQTVQVMQPQERAWYEQSQNQSNQSSAQQQEQQRQNREDSFSYSAQDDGSTEDFLSVMQQLNSI